MSWSILLAVFISNATLIVVVAMNAAVVLAHSTFYPEFVMPSEGS
jgi:hypothetical protein